MKQMAVGAKLKGNIKHSVSKWCFGKIPLDEFCEVCKSIGIESIELLDPHEWPVVQRHGLTVAMPQGAGLGINKGFNDVSLHDELVLSYEAVIPKVAAAGLKNLICFAGTRSGVSDEVGWNNCAKGLKRIMPTAERYGVTIVMELLNTYDHGDYLCSRTAWGVELCKRVGSDRMKLLYDIYHMQRMEGEIIATLRRSIDYIAHVHTGGVPGRNEIDARQELNYPAIMRALVELGYDGFVGQEFVPKDADVVASLRNSILICDV